MATHYVLVLYGHGTRNVQRVVFELFIETRLYACALYFRYTVLYRSYYPPLTFKPRTVIYFHLRYYRQTAAFTFL